MTCDEEGHRLGSIFLKWFPLKTVSSHELIWFNNPTKQQQYAEWIRRSSFICKKLRWADLLDWLGTSKPRIVIFSHFVCVLLHFSRWSALLFSCCISLDHTQERKEGMKGKEMDSNELYLRPQSDPKTAAARTTEVRKRISGCLWHRFTFWFSCVVLSFHGVKNRFPCFQVNNPRFNCLQFMCALYYFFCDKTAVRVHPIGQDEVAWQREREETFF